MAYAAVISLQKTIQNLLDSPRLSLVPPTPQIIKMAYNELKSLKEILQRLDESSKSSSRKKMNALDARIKEVVWEFEDLVESHVYNQIFLPHASEIVEVNLEGIRDEVDSFTKMLKEKEEEYAYELHHLVPQEEEEEAFDAACEKTFKLVGSSWILSKIRAKLKPEFGLDAIPVVGMAGIGKSTIAKEIFDDPLLFTDFKYECRAWVNVGRKCELDKLKQDILVQLDPDHEIMRGEGRNEGQYLREILKAKRCLIVLDNIWNTYIWDHLKSFFPNFGPRRRSRVLLTTRLQHVARHIHHYFPLTLHVELLSKDESWDLLRQRVFGEEEEDCPYQFTKAGKKIAEKCDGLPLMIVVVAELLSKADDKSVEYWEEVAESKNSSIFMAAYDQISKVLFPSYEYLPQHLKPCFLHMGVFPQKYEIFRFKLLSMWIGEGFLESNIEETMEKCGGKYLGELIDHNVVITCQKSHTSDPRIGDDIKTCRLHSSFWHLCNREATNNKFFRVLSSRVDGFHESLKSQRRLSFHNNILFSMNDVFDVVEDRCASTARSLLCYGPYYPYQVPVCFGLRLLKLLDAIQIRFYEFPLKVLRQVYLRYLALTCNDELPASVSKLWNLQLLIIHRNMSIKHSGKTSFLPIEIWDMKELKHIEIMGSNLPNPSSAFSLKSLLTLKGVGVETCTKEVLERIPNLKKLGIQIELYPNDDHIKAFHCLDHIHVLSELLSLKCVVVNPTLRSETVALPARLPTFPRSLKKLHLSGLGYPWEYMSTVVSLPNLQVLKLRCYAFRGRKWELKEDIVKWRLKYLLIEGSDLVQFEVKGGNLRSLRSLGIKHCYKLQLVKFDPDLSSPFEIEVIDCSSSTVNFANEIRSRYAFAKEHQKFNLHSSWDDG